MSALSFTESTFSDPFLLKSASAAASNIIIRSSKSASKENANTLRCDAPQVVFQECPDEVALCFSIYGCPLRCPGCHSEHLWRSDVTGETDEQQGEALTLSRFEAYLNQYQGMVTAVVFFGGEWQPHTLQELLKTAQGHGLKTCLYSGLENVSRHLRPHLDFVKLGPWREELGGLDSVTTNQRFYRVEQGELGQCLNHLFVCDDSSISPEKINLDPVNSNPNHSNPVNSNPIYNLNEKQKEASHVAA